MNINEQVVRTLKIDDRRKKQDLAFLQTIIQHHKDIKSGKLSLLRSFPQWMMRLLEPNHYDVVFVNGARKPSQMPRILDQVSAKLKPGGLAVFNSYRENDTAGRATIEALHDYLGQHPRDWRAMGSDASHIAVEAI